MLLSPMPGRITLHRVGSGLVDLSAQIPPSYDVALQSHSLVKLYHMVETEALFRQQEVLGPLCSGPETRIILFLQLQLNV